jgi:2-dehydropantoate 2-reductase
LKICVYGAGAVGGSLAARLQRVGAGVSVIARGAHGAAIRRSGLTLIAGDDRVVVRVKCVEVPGELEAQDVVVVAVKSTQLPAIATTLGSLLTPATRVVFAMNGIPWWFGDGLAVALPDALVAALDPDARLRRAIDLDRIIGAVVYSSNEVVAPGVILNSTPDRNRMILGKPDGGNDAVLDAMVDLLSHAGYDATATPSIRQALWTKMLIVVGASPVAALTGAALDQLVADESSLALMTALMQEGDAIGRRLGFVTPDDIGRRLAFYRDQPVRPSLLQDFEAGREPELDGGILAFAAIAAAAGVRVPVMDLVATLVRMKAVAMGSRARS